MTSALVHEVRLRVAPVPRADLLDVLVQPCDELALGLEGLRVVVVVTLVEEVDGLVVHHLVARGSAVRVALQQQVHEDADVRVIFRVAKRHEHEVELFALGLGRELELDTGVVGVQLAVREDTAHTGRFGRCGGRAHEQVLSVLSVKVLQGNPLVVWVNYIIYVTKKQ